MITWHFKRFWWAYALALILVVIPLIIIRAQRLPPLDLKSVKFIYQRYDKAIIARYGQPISDEYDKAQTPLAEVFNTGNDPRLARLIQFGALGGMPCLAEDARQVQAAYGPLLSPFEQFDQSGIYYRTYDDIEKKVAASKNIQELNNLRLGPVPNFFLIQIRTKLYRALAGQAVSRQDWDGALTQLQLAAHTADSVRLTYLIGHLIAVACRAIAYNGYADLLAANPPEAVLHQALTDLTELRQTDPVGNDWVIATENRCIMDGMIVWAIGRERSSLKFSDSRTAIDQYLNMSGVLLYLIRHKDQIKDKTQRAWIDQLLRDYPEIADHVDTYGSMHFVKTLSTKPSFTFIPSIRRLAIGLIETQPELFASDILPLETLKTLDPWTVAMLAPNYLMGGINYLEVGTRSNMTITQGRLMEMTFAARLFERDKGHWPEQLDDLIPAYLPAFDEGYVDDEGKGIMTPMRMGWVEVNPDLKHKMMRDMFFITKDYRSIAAISFDSATGNLNTLGVYPRHDNGTIDSASTFTITLNETRDNEQIITQTDSPRHVYNQSELTYLNDPVLPLAWVQTLQAHPRLVSDAEAVIPEVTLKGHKPGFPESDPLTMSNADFDIQFSPLDGDYARRVTDQTDALFWATRAQVLPPDKRDKNKPNLKTRTDEPPLQVMVRGKLTFPDRMFAIWSPGPDGKDDSGQIVYDPSNGTLSKGDILAFPERF